MHRHRMRMVELIDPTGIPALRDAIRHVHGCESRWVESVPVHETRDGGTVWQGDVQVFDLVGHPVAKRAYAFSHSPEGGRRRIHAVLGLEPITDATTAVRTQVLSEERARNSEKS